ncbi:fimbrial assembly protein PilN [Orenia metallireducens]|jgi:Tfp pilus assembly protein PilN|uniref:Fimbrial assembly protein (PilN) n=1 Tax=Orenia metallireducens TaxID=1413210 RepID=A0A285HK98_9FIRM|nr:PilN domain-containing protein [Orenia metallireducens]PRX26681.1 fimbrial assembly protein PilN [Orenia metallireducens]SNY36074.1 Fimbrial assembly protein (PilN) [Orenia metallireducens]
MVNFLTDDFFKKERINNLIFVGALLSLVLIASISHIYLKLYFENKELELKQEAIRTELSKLDSSLLKVEDLKDKRRNIEEKLSEKNEFLAKMVSSTRIFKELDLLYSNQLYLKNFQLSNNNFQLLGVTTEVKYLNQLNQRLEVSDFFDEFYLEGIDKLDDRLEFKLRGTLQKGE